MERRNKLQELRYLSVQIARAKTKLSSKDYVGRKISEVLLMGTQQEIDAIKKEYATVLAEAKILRENINKWQSEMEAIRKEMFNNKKE